MLINAEINIVLKVGKSLLFKIVTVNMTSVRDLSAVSVPFVIYSSNRNIVSVECLYRLTSSYPAAAEVLSYSATRIHN